MYLKMKSDGKGQEFFMSERFVASELLWLVG